MKFQKSVPKDYLARFAKDRNFATIGGYKALRREHALRLVKEGAVRIGTLKEFTALESDQLRDEEEGLNVAALPGGLVEADSIHPESVVRKILKFTAPGSTLTGLGKFVVEFDFPTYCFSFADTKETIDSLCDSTNGYDAIVRISDRRQFGEAIAARFNELRAEDECKTVRFISLPVLYEGRDYSPFEASPPNWFRAFQKPPRFSKNVEGRIVFIGDAWERFALEMEDKNRVVLVPALRELVEIIK